MFLDIVSLFPSPCFLTTQLYFLPLFPPYTHTFLYSYSPTLWALIFKFTQRLKSRWLKTTRGFMLLLPAESSAWSWGWGWRRSKFRFSGVGDGDSYQYSFSFPKQLEGQKPAILKCVWISSPQLGDRCAYL